MRLSDFNEYIQTMAALGAIIALIAVGYEIRQSNRIASQQAVSATWTNWIDTTVAEIESGISTTLAKSMTNPDDLALEEKIDLNSFLQAFVYKYHHDYEVLYMDDNPVLVARILEEVVMDAPIIFGSRFSRAWLQENRSWMVPEIIEAIDRSLKDIPVGSDLEYYRRIDTLAATL
ncbi:MAG: hypothetical protein V7720_15250 [Halioglobus sp.]